MPKQSKKPRKSWQPPEVRKLEAGSAETRPPKRIVFGLALS